MAAGEEFDILHLFLEPIDCLADFTEAPANKSVLDVGLEVQPESQLDFAQDRDRDVQTLK
jgi:hypothetical protein